VCSLMLVEQVSFFFGHINGALLVLYTLHTIDLVVYVNRTECEVIESLLQADIAMSKWCYPESLLHLQNAHTKISHILSVVSPQATKTSTLIKIGFLGMKTASNPELHVWLKKYKDAIYSKVIILLIKILV